MCRKINNTKRELKKWNEMSFGHCKTRIKRLQDAINLVQMLQATKENLLREKHLCHELEEVHRREEIHWKQKSRVSWLDEGDDNTGFFHVLTVIRRRRNGLDCIKKDNGDWVFNREDIGNAFVEYFWDLFKTCNPFGPNDFDHLLENSISDAQNARLNAIPSYSEIKKIVKLMAPTKAPGPDGMSALFYQHYWTTVGKDLVVVVQKKFRSGRMLSELNRTHITLIPKHKVSNKVIHFRPISLCNVAYKVISKVIANHLKPLLNSLVSPFQTTFIVGRNISENVILTQELLHGFKSQKGRKGHMTIKFDISKAYDKMEWSFIYKVLASFGFDKVFINLISQCISTTSLSVLVNGSPHGIITPQRGLRQGDPLSPYLFYARRFCQS